MTRDQKYLQLIGILIDFLRGINARAIKSPSDRVAVENLCKRISDIAKKI